MQDQEQKFRIYGFIDLQKSLSSSSIDKNGVLIEGRFLNSVKDISGERPIVPEMIWDILKKSGNIKYEHDPLAIKKMEDGTFMAVSEANPKNIMGAVLNVETSPDGKEAHFQATLFPENPLTKSLIDTARQFDEHNKRYPKNQRHFQLSVEGKYYKRDKLNKTYAGIAENIVISPQAQDDTTYFQFVNAENLAMAKSLEAGYETDMAKLKDGGALRKESLEGRTKNNTYSRSNKMEKLGKNRDEVFTHFKKSCKTTKEAMEKTDAYMKEIEEEREKEKGEGGSFKKSLDAGIDKIRKSIAAFNDVATLIATKQTDVVKVDADMKKSITTLRETPDQFNGEQFIAQQAQATIVFGTNLNDIQTQLVKSLALLAEGLADTLPLLKDIHSMTIDAVEQATDANETARYVARGIKKSQQGFTHSTDALEPLGGGDQIPDDQLLKSINVNPIKSFLVDRQVAYQNSNPALAQEYSNAFMLLDERRNAAFEVMNKSIVTEIVTWIKPQLPIHQQ
jgi:hypothetical protein